MRNCLTAVTEGMGWLIGELRVEFLASCLSQSSALPLDAHIISFSIRVLLFLGVVFGSLVIFFHIDDKLPVFWGGVTQMFFGELHFSDISLCHKSCLLSGEGLLRSCVLDFSDVLHLRTTAFDDGVWVCFYRRKDISFDPNKNYHCDLWVNIGWISRWKTNWTSRKYCEEVTETVPVGRSIMPNTAGWEDFGYKSYYVGHESERSGNSNLIWAQSGLWETDPKCFKLLRRYSMEICGLLNYINESVAERKWFGCPVVAVSLGALQPILVKKLPSIDNFGRRKVRHKDICSWKKWVEENIHPSTFVEGWIDIAEEFSNRLGDKFDQRKLIFVVQWWAGSFIMIRPNNLHFYNLV